MLDTPTKIFRAHLAIIGLLGLANAAVLIIGYLGHQRLWGLTEFLLLSKEDNLPSFFSAAALLVVAAAAWSVHKSLPSGSNDRAGWFIFALSFIFLAADEWFQIHEHLPIRTTLVGTALYLFPMIPLALLMLPFWLRQQSRVRNGIAFGGVAYMLFAIAFEVLEKKIEAAGISSSSWQIYLSTGVEEVGEMFAVAIFLRTFLIRFADLGGGRLISLNISPSEPAYSATAVAAE